MLHDDVGHTFCGCAMHLNLHFFKRLSVYLRMRVCVHVYVYTRCISYFQPALFDFLSGRLYGKTI